MNIIIVVFDISRMAGTERAVTNLANSLHKSKNYNVSIVSFSNFLSKPAFPLEEGIELKYLNFPNFGNLNLLNKLFYYIKSILILRNLCHNNIQFIIGTAHGINFLLPISLLNENTITIGCEHMSYHAIPSYSKFIRKILYKWLDAIVVLTEGDMKLFETINENTFVIPNSITITANISDVKNNNILLSIGRFMPQKGFDILIPKMSKIFSLYPDWRWMIYGDGEEKHRLNKLIMDSYLGNNIFLNNPLQNIKSAYLASALYLMPSRWEGFPMVLLEAISYGLPAISFNCQTGPADIINDNEDGFLIEPNNVEDFINKIIILIDDEQLRVKMSQHAILNSKRFISSQIYYKWDKLFSFLTDN